MNILDTLANKAYERVESHRPITPDSPISSIKAYIEDVYRLLQSEKHYSVGVSHLCHICDNIPNDQLIVDITFQCIKSSRIFLYQSMLHNRGIKTDDRYGVIDIAQRSFYSLKNNTLLTKEQKSLFDTFLKKRKLVVSAPTSFGKSLIVREIISNSDYKSIVIIVPTNALLSETYYSVRMDESLSEYKIIFSTHLKPVKGKVIYIFTPEKFDLYSDEHNIHYDFFVFDEIYKIDSRDNRSSVFSSCLYKAYKEECDYYFIGPYFKSFSRKYLNKTNGVFKKFSTEIVQKQVSHYYSETSIFLNNVMLPSLKGKDPRLKKVLAAIDGQTIVYVCRKDSAETRSKCIAKIENSVKNKHVSELIDYIKKNISEEWCLLSTLSKGVAFHHAGVPKYLQTEIVDLFNNGILSVIVCTPTLTEGVNTTAKNVIFYDTTKANIDLTGFEVKNIVGRSGRFGKHFVGRAIFLEEPVQQDELDEIKFPLFDYEDLSDEDNIQINIDDLSTEGKKQREEILGEARSYNIPIDVLKKNKYVSFEKQIELINILRENKKFEAELTIESSLPSKEQVSLIMELTHDILFSESDKSDNWSMNRLSRFVKQQIYFNPSIKELISDYDAVREDTKIRNVLGLIYRYFEYSLPKYLITFENLYNFVYKTPLSLSLMVTHLQYGSNKIQDILLTDAGVPKSIIKEISSKLEGIETIDDIKRILDSNPHYLSSLSNIEIKMLARRI